MRYLGYYILEHKPPSPDLAPIDNHLSKHFELISNPKDSTSSSLPLPDNMPQNYFHKADELG